ncbi:energy transducer TonB [Edaphobacter sp.]|uniref:energy transducer TonB n=1 Tax=Edaphobacter sp. TaxID=1934404 RepID=UPI002DBB3B06|nr:energy transducer TonB [Edaphobacter sp.]HEU5342542.1 energy transducer TonB [Edaphobacter sp.]
MFSHHDLMVDVTIDAPPNGDYTQAISAVFANGLAEIAPLLPSYWKGYATKNFLPATNEEPTASSEPASKPVNTLQNRGITAPVLKHSVNPQFSNTARALKYSGTVLVDLWITPDGKATRLSIADPTGAGLDEQALAAVEQYTFTPAMQNGKPVLVELKVKVNFQIF